jgi:hemolysin activation/secretion protein
MVEKARRIISKWAVFIIICAFAVITGVPAYAVDGADEDGPKAEAISNKMSAARTKSPAIVIKQRVEAQIPKPTLPSGKTMIKEIRVSGATILAPRAIERLKTVYENRELTGRELQYIADRVTRAYSREGYITSYGYINPEKLGEGILQIVVKEGRTGKITIEGNKNFSTRILRKKITLQEGDYFNFKKLNSDVFKMNKHPDRKVAITCDPSVDTGLTDVLLTVKDKSPFHVTLQMDNYGSEAITYKRYKTYFTHNNLTGHDDSLTFKAQITESAAHKLFDFDYFIPLNNDWKWEIYYMPYKLEDYCCGTNVDTDFEKHAWKWYTYLYQSLINEPGCELVSSYGFVHKNIHWWQYGSKRKSDLFAAALWSLDLNKSDRYGRWVVSNDLEVGIPRLFGTSTREDESCSVAGAGGGYKKNHLIVARRQKLVNDIDWLGKAHWQLSSQSQPGVNVFSIGGFMGVIDMRGFPRAQAPGDQGYSFSTGFSFPPFGVSRKLSVPYSTTKIYDALRLFTFMDYAKASFKTYQDGSPKHYEYTSGGVGFELKVPDKNTSVRLDLGWPLSDQQSKDGDHAHAWFAITKGF